MIKVSFAKPDITQQEIDAVVDVMKSGWVTTGEVCRRFEEDLAARIGVPVGAVMAVSHNTGGMHLVLMALGIGPGDEVLIPTLTFAATAEVVRAVGATPVLVDVEPETHGICVDAAAKKLTARTKVIMPVHFAGCAYQVARVMQFAEQHGLMVVEDAAHAYGTFIDLEGVSAAPVGRQMGPLHMATVFSFYATKTISTGEGGAVVAFSSSLCDKIRRLRLHGITRDAFDRYKSAGSWEYDVGEPGWKYNLTDMAAAMGVVQVMRNCHMRSMRRKIQTGYDFLLGLPSLPHPDGSSIHLYMLTGLPNRDQFIRSMAEHGVVCSVHFKPLHRMTAYAAPNEEFLVAEKHWLGCASLPCFSAMTQDQVDTVIAAVRSSV